MVFLGNNCLVFFSNVMQVENTSESKHYYKFAVSLELYWLRFRPQKGNTCIKRLGEYQRHVYVNF